MSMMITAMLQRTLIRNYLKTGFEGEFDQSASTFQAVDWVQQEAVTSFSSQWKKAGKSIFSCLNFFKSTWDKWTHRQTEVKKLQK